MISQIGSGFTIGNKMALGNAGTPPDPGIIVSTKLESASFVTTLAGK